MHSAIDGRVVQAYARARWGDDADAQEALRISKQLDRNIQHRIDVLGFDGERLLSVPPGEVLAMLDTLEAEALLEDSGASESVLRGAYGHSAGHGQNRRRRVR